MSKPQRSDRFLKTGHAPGHLRECLLNALEHDGDWFNHLEMDFLRERHQRWWNQASPSERALWLLGQLWSCNDVVPSLTRSMVRDWLDQDREHFSFATLARALKKDLEARAIPSNPQTQPTSTAQIALVKHEKTNSEPREVLVTHSRPTPRTLTVLVGRREP